MTQPVPNSSNPQCEAVERDLRSAFEQMLPRRIDRALSLPHHRLVPNHYFASASSECISLWRDGYFLSALMVSQALVEGICRFVLQKHKFQTCCKPPDAAKILAARQIISQQCADAIHRIWGSFRNDVHHMNPNVVEVPIEQLAKSNLDDLSIVESEIFAFSFVEGKLFPKTPLYWDVQDDGTVSVSVRCT